MKTRIISLCIAVVLVATACADVTGSALEVNGEGFDRSELVDLLGDVREELESDDVQLQFDLGNGTVPTAISATVLSVFVQNEVMGQALRERSIDVTAEEIQAAAATAQPSGSPAFDELQAEWSARLAAVQEAQIDIAELFIASDVELDPRFGVWEPTQASVIPG